MEEKNKKTLLDFDAEKANDSLITVMVVAIAILMIGTINVLTRDNLAPLDYELESKKNEARNAVSDCYYRTKDLAMCRQGWDPQGYSR